MMFNSMQFVIFFPIAVLFYFIFPHKFRCYWLLALSYYYYMCWNPKYALLLLLSTTITYLSGLVIGKYNDNLRIKKLSVAISFLSNIAILGFFKYFTFAVESINSVLSIFGSSHSISPRFDVLLPVGISFYIFQALSYTMDVYRGEIASERNFFKYALFVSFFPQLVAGPIERSKNLLSQFDQVHHFEYERVRNGLLRMLWGFFLKLVIAQRLAIIVDRFYDNSQYCTGYQMLLATILFAFQIYCDFASYSEIAIGSAEVLGFTLMENFKQPFFAKSCKELWNRWHISLNTWFRDYLYFPLGGSRKGTVRKHLNLMIVFLVSGLWHGAAWTYVLWGGLSGLFQVIGDLVKTPREKILHTLHLKEGKLGQYLSIICTFLLFCFSLVFFRSKNLEQAFTILSQIFSNFSFASILSTSPFALGIGAYHFMILVFAMIVLFIIDLYREKGNKLSDISNMKWYIRWSFYLLMVVLILLSANFGSEEFIYFQF